MSLVAYGSSDESSDDEGSNSETSNTTNTPIATVVKQTNEKLCLPTPKYDTISKNSENNANPTVSDTDKIHFENLPKPKNVNTEAEDIIEEEDDIPPRKDIELQSEKAVKKDRVPVKITVPSLSDFKDVEEENEAKRNKIMPSCKGTKLFALLPPPKGAEVKSTRNLIPHVLSKSGKTNNVKVQPTKPVNIEQSTSKSNKKPQAATTGKSIGLLSYDSNSEDEDDVVSNSSNPTTDFFALSASESASEIAVAAPLDINLDVAVKNSLNGSSSSSSSTITTEEPSLSSSDKTLVSNVMNLPREEILLKNKAEVGPKLPVPEQEYNVDREGNVAFDEKAIEYLCGRRGVKRKNKEIDEANIIEINGEDIKPDEREWLVKALTKEPIERPVSMQGGGVNSQSKKKHQITYLAHQAKAMEMELKNQWAQNRMTRKQTQSKYGF